jgi:hypothetical protein
MKNEHRRLHVVMTRNEESQKVVFHFFPSNIYSHYVSWSGVMHVFRISWISSLWSWKGISRHHIYLNNIFRSWKLRIPVCAVKSSRLGAVRVMCHRNRMLRFYCFLLLQMRTLLCNLLIQPCQVLIQIFLRSLR